MTAELTIYEKLAEAKIPHYTGADSFALNGAFVGYGVDYANLGKETANIIASILIDKKAPKEKITEAIDKANEDNFFSILMFFKILIEEIPVYYSEIANTIFEIFFNRKANQAQQILGLKSGIEFK